MVKVLIDTSLLIEFLRQPDRETWFKKISLSRQIRPAVALVTVTELWVGKSTLKKEIAEIVKGLIDRCEVIIPNVEVAELSGWWLRDGEIQALPDAEIAAIAVVNDLPLATLNKRHFKKVKGLKFWDRLTGT